VIQIHPALDGASRLRSRLKLLCHAAVAFRVADRAFPWLLVFALLGCFALPSWLHAQETVPLYRFDTHLDSKGHRIVATMRVELSPEDERAGQSWWFGLQPNRFLASDPRGPRRRLDSVPFGYSYLTSAYQDTMQPAGFSEGNIRILSVEDGLGRPLNAAYEDNPQVQVGFSVKRGLMRVDFRPDSPCCAAVVRFETNLPNRVWDGWSDTGVYTEHWMPNLLPLRGGDWVRDPAEPAQARCSGKFQADRKGWLVLADAKPERVSPGGIVERPPDVAPSRACLLAFLPKAKAAITERHGVIITSLYRTGDDRVGGLMLDVAEGFLEFAEQHYNLAYPKKHLTFIPSDWADGDLIASDGAVIVPAAEYKNSPVLDRVLVGRVSRAVAQQWFGETVFVNEDREAWLIWGLSGYLSLEFFDFLYGWDAPTHNITDWLAPRYREHYFEGQVRGLVRNDQDAPLDLSLWNYPRATVARVIVHHKAPLVLRQLEHVVGNATFHDAVRRYESENRDARGGAAKFQAAVEREANLDFGWYFDDWVRGVTLLDFELRKIDQTPTADGYDVDIDIRRRKAPRMPVEVLVSTEGGEDITTRWEGTGRDTILHLHTQSRVTRVVLDPREHLMEIDRKNNYSDANVRVRPFFDWSKDREVLVSLQGRAGGNAIDGNFVMLGASVDLDADNEIHVIPGYGQDSEELVYDVGWIHKRFLFPRLDLTFSRSRIGGRDFLGTAFGYHHDVPERMAWDSTLEFRVEHVDALPQRGNTPIGLQSPGQVNNVNLLEFFTIDPTGPTYHQATLELERSQPEWRSDFQYTLARLDWLNGFELAYDHIVELTFVRGAIDGNAPVQKKPLLGDPLVLRGYPRSINLVFDQLAAVRLDYRYIFSRGVNGRELQTRKITGLLFTDLGKGWDNGESPDSQPQRQDAGFGIEIELELVGQVSFPIRIEVAQPYNDKEYKRIQFIFFQALAFF
jgi:hypothetical protein